ncbi:hypothetical protein BGW38_006246, partial [Lunasporangiospora selenospora]
MGRPDGSPSTTGSPASFSSASLTSSPSTLSLLPAPALTQSVVTASSTATASSHTTTRTGGTHYSGSEQKEIQMQSQGRVETDPLVQSSSLSSSMLLSSSVDDCTGQRANGNSGTNACVTSQSSDKLLPTETLVIPQQQGPQQPHIHISLPGLSAQEQPPMYTPHANHISSHTSSDTDDDDHGRVEYQSKDKGKGKNIPSGWGHGNDDSSDSDNSESSDDVKGKGKGKGVDTGKGKGTEIDSSQLGLSISSASSGLYTHPSTGSTNLSSRSSLPSVSEEDESTETTTTTKASSYSASSFLSKDKYAKATSTTFDSVSGSGSSSGFGPSSSAHARNTTSSSHYSYINNGGSSSNGSGSSSGAGGSSSKPVLLRASTTPALGSSSSSSAAPPPLPSTPVSSSFQQSSDISAVQDFSMYGYESIPADFDFGDLPTDPRTGIIYGDPHAITQPFLNPSMYFDHYSLAHDAADPRRINVFNKYGALLYYHPGRHIGQDQDSLRSNVNNTTIWTVSGRSSTWGSLTATESGSKRQIRIVMESNKKKAAAAAAAAAGTVPIEAMEPLARFVFRWKEDDYVAEYRKQKDQYRITSFQMCGGDSKWKPPQSNMTRTMFHGMGMDGPGNPHMEFPLAALLRGPAISSGLMSGGGPLMIGGQANMHQAIIDTVGSPIAASLAADHSGPQRQRAATSSFAGLKAAALSAADVSPPTTVVHTTKSAPPAPTMARRATVSAPMSS